MEAAKGGHRDVVNLLLARGANIEAMNLVSNFCYLSIITIIHYSIICANCDHFSFNSSFH